VPLFLVFFKEILCADKLQDVIELIPVFIKSLVVTLTL